MPKFLNLKHLRVTQGSTTNFRICMVRKRLLRAPIYDLKNISIKSDIHIHINIATARIRPKRYVGPNAASGPSVAHPRFTFTMLSSLQITKYGLRYTLIIIGIYIILMHRINVRRNNITSNWLTFASDCFALKWLRVKIKRQFSYFY